MQKMSYPYETWTVCKPKVTGSKGVVVAQEIEAASIGAGIIESGCLLYTSDAADE